MNIIIKLKNNIRKYIRKYIAVACSLLLIPIFSVNAFAFVLPLDGYLFWHTNQRDMQLRVYHGNTRTNLAGVMNDLSLDYKNANFPNNVAFTGVTGFRYSFTQAHSLFEFPFDFSNYDYYASVTIVNNASNDALNYIPTRGQIASYVDGELYFADMLDVSVLSAGGNTSDGFTLIGRIPDSIGSYVYGFTVIGGTAVDVPAGDFICNAYIWQVEKGEDYTNADVITAINNQTTQLGNKLDGIDTGIDKGNDLIENGNSGTQSAITDFNEVFEDFNTELDTWEQFDDDIIGEFNNANENYMAELDNFSLSGSLLNAGTWLSTSMQTVYDNSSDYKMLWLVPLLFGIPILLFIIRKNGDDE